MKKKESTHPKPMILTTIFCLLFVLIGPINATDSKSDRTESEDQIFISIDKDTPSSEPILTRLASSFSLTQLVAETPNSFDIQPFRLEDKPNDLNTKIQLPRSFKPNGFEAAAFTTSLVTLAALNVADVVTTLQALKYDGLTEANPMMKPFVKNVYVFTAIKLGVTAFNYYLLKKLHIKNKPLAWVLSMAANLAMSYVVAHNLRMIQDARVR
jgi:hypothetical protein